MWRAEHATLGSEVAIKLIDPAVAQNEEIRARFMREAQSAAQLRSPHVVQILDYGVDDDTPFIAMELLVGESLADRLDRVGRIPLEQTSQIVTEVARALTRAHEAGIIHRDLKPDNIFLVHNDDVEVAKVLDFGVAKKQDFGIEQASMTTTGAVLGTPYYMSPEQAEGLKNLDHRTDIWALAVIAYECVLGVRPFESDTLGGLFLAICTRDKPVPSLRYPELPPGFDEWFEKGTARQLVDRFATARDAAQALRAIVSTPSASGEGRHSLSSDANIATAKTMVTPMPGTSPGAATNPAFLATSTNAPSTAAVGTSVAAAPAVAPAPDRASPALTTGGASALSAPAVPVRSSRSPYVLGGLVGVVALTALGWLVGGSDEPEKDATAEDTLSAAQAAEDEAREKKLAEDRENEKLERDRQRNAELEKREAEIAQREEASKLPPEPPQAAPAAAPAPTVRPARAAAPRPAPKPAPAPRPEPKPEPKEEGVNLGI